MILVIDNYDSFAYNLARYIELAGCAVKVMRNDQITLEEIRRMAPQAIVISPGPCTPAQAGISRALIEELGASVPILGVCLGHQAIGEAYGGRTVRALFPMHGKSSRIAHSCAGIFSGIETDFEVGRYHSLIMELPKNSPLEITAQSRDGDIMAVQHKTHPVYGVQFHPESILTKHGHLMIKNFIMMAECYMRSSTMQAYGQIVARNRRCCDFNMPEDAVVSAGFNKNTELVA